MSLTFEQGRASQAASLASVIGTLRAQRLAFTGPGPVFVGIGASLAAACAPVWALRSRGIDAWRLGAGDSPLPFPPSEHPVVGVSQSGRSAETLAVLEAVPPPSRFAVVNTVPSPIASVASTLVDLGNVPDSYASTAGYTATVIALGMMADAWNGGGPDPSWEALPALVAATEAAVTGEVTRLAALFDDANAADFVGGGPSTGSAEEAALLFREVARVPSAGIGTRQYLHGAMESAGATVHVLFGGDREAQVASTLAAADHRVILVTSGPAVPSVPTVRVASCAPAQRAILEIVVAQVLVSAVAARRGIDAEEFVFHNADTKVKVLTGAPRHRRRRDQDRLRPAI